MGVDHVGAGGLQQQIQELYRMVRRLGKATLNNASVGGAGIRVYDAGVIRFEEGGGIVIAGSGYITIDGDLTGVGDLSWSGPWDLAGLGTVTGDVAWSGDLNLTGDIKVLSGGTIQVGGSSGITLNGSTGEILVGGTYPIRLKQVGGGAVLEVGGTTISEQSGLLKIDSGSGVGIFQDSFSLQLKSGGVAFVVGSFGPQIVGLPAAAQADYPGSFPGAVVANSTGQLFRVI